MDDKTLHLQIYIISRPIQIAVTNNQTTRKVLRKQKQLLQSISTPSYHFPACPVATGITIPFTASVRLISIESFVGPIPRGVSGSMGRGSWTEASPSCKTDNASPTWPGL